MIELPPLVSLVVFTVGVVLTVRNLPVPASEGRDESAQHEHQEAEPESDAASASEAEVECDTCGPESALRCVDEYVHDGIGVACYVCDNCGACGTLGHYPDGHTVGRGCLAAQGDQRAYTLADGARTLFACVRCFATRSVGLVKRLLARLQAARSRQREPAHEPEEPCVESLRCDHEETTTAPITYEGDEYAETTCVDCGTLVEMVPASESDVFLAGDRFDCRDGSTWEIVDPWIPVEIDGTMVGTVCIERQGAAGGRYWIGSPSFESLVEDGGFTPIEEPDEEQAEEAETVAADGGTSGECEGFGTVINRLQTFDSALVWVHDDNPGAAEHLTYYDESSDGIDAEAIAYLRSQGFEILNAGQKECAASDQEQAYLEIQRGAGAVGNGGERR